MAVFVWLTIFELLHLGISGVFWVTGRGAGGGCGNTAGGGGGRSTTFFSMLFTWVFLISSTLCPDLSLFRSLLLLRWRRRDSFERLLEWSRFDFRQLPLRDLSRWWLWCRSLGLWDLLCRWCDGERLRERCLCFDECDGRCRDSSIDDRWLECLWCNFELLESRLSFECLEPSLTLLASEKVNFFPFKEIKLLS